MSYKTATYVSLLFFAAISIYFLTASAALPPASGNQIGPAYFPRAISILLILFCIISFFKTLKKKDEEKLRTPNLLYIVVTLLLTFFFVIVWQWTNRFYVPAFVFIAILIYLYNQTGHSSAKVIKSTVISLAIILAVYLIFGILLDVSFV